MHCEGRGRRGWGRQRGRRGGQGSLTELMPRAMVPPAILEALRAGSSVVYPTSSLPGLGCLPQAAALDRLFAIKRRPAHMVVSLGVASLHQAEQLVHVPDDARRLLGAFDRGSLTLVLPAVAPLDPRLGGESVAVRVFANDEAIALADAVGPLTATSANVHGVQPELDCAAAARALGLEQGLALPGACGDGTPSTLVRWNGEAALPLAPPGRHLTGAPTAGAAEAEAAARWTVLREGPPPLLPYLRT